MNDIAKLAMSPCRPVARPRWASLRSAHPTVLDLGRDDSGVDLDYPAGEVRGNPLDFIEQDLDELDLE